MKMTSPGTRPGSVLSPRQGHFRIRVRLLRRLRRLPVVRQAYAQGRVRRMAAQTIAGMLLRAAPDATVPLTIPTATQEAWVERASAATCRRLQDETRAVARLMLLGKKECVPLDDLTWHAFLYRQAGMARQRVQALTRMALASPVPLLPLRLVLKQATAGGRENLQPRWLAMHGAGLHVTQKPRSPSCRLSVTGWWAPTGESILPLSLPSPDGRARAAGPGAR